MMVAQVKPLDGFEDWHQQAGLGSQIWNPYSYFAARYYHYIIAGFNTVILVLALALHTPDWFLLGVLGVYGLYFFTRQLISDEWKRRFYLRHNQFRRAQIALVATGFVLAGVQFFYPSSEWLTLWLIFVPIILLTSKHCTTEQMLLVVGEAGAILLGLRLIDLAQTGMSFTPGRFFIDNADLWLKFLWIGQLAFVLHFLVRNVQARDETIAAYRTVTQLAREVDMTDVTSAREWQPLLAGLIERVHGGCAAAWLVDTKTQQLRRIASLKRDAVTGQWIEGPEHAAGLSVALDSDDLIARVVGTGQAQHRRVHGDSAARAICPDLTAELAVPINIGSSEAPAILGVLSVGFRAPTFQDRLIPEYENYMQALIHQAKPMLVYGQRLDELASLLEVIRQISHSLDLDQVLDNFLHAIVDRLGFEFATISLVDDAQRLFRSVRGINVPEQWVKMASHSLDSNDIQAHIVRTGETLVLSDWDDRFDWQLYEKFEHGDLLRIFTPLGSADAATQQLRIIGTIEAGYFQKEHAAITTDQVRMLDALKIYLVMAIEHAQLLRRTQLKAEVLTSLHQVGQTIASAREPSAVLNEIGHSAQSLLQADVVMLYRYHPEGPTIDDPLIFGDIGERFKAQLDLSQDNLLTQLVRETTPYYRSDAQHDPLLVPPVNAADGRLTKSKKTFIQLRNIRSFAGIPLVAHGETLGVMFVNYRAHHSFTADERQIHELFAQQAAVAIKNAASNELARQVIIRDERAHLSRELHHSVSQALFSIKVKAHWLLECVGVDHPQIKAELEKMAEIAHEAGNETGYIIDELRTPVDDTWELATGVAEYVRRIQRWYDIRAAWEINNCPPLSTRVEQTLLRLTREALNNAVRHAHCQSIMVTLSREDQRLQLVVHDDGRGFNPASVLPGKWGLINMHELTAQIGGQLSIETQPGSGTTIRIWLDPIHEEE